MKILLVHTGGTIGSSQKDAREQSADSARIAKKDLIGAFERSMSPYVGKVEIKDSEFPEHETTLSESMTPQKLGEIIFRINADMARDKYDGVVVLHGTDTLAYTAALFAFVFANIKIPMLMVSGNRPPKDPASNASANFIAAVNLICEGIAPNVYAVYRNSDGKMRLFLASAIMQSANFSEDFTSASEHKCFELIPEGKRHMLDACNQYSRERDCSENFEMSKLKNLSDRVLIIRPYTGLDYSLYENAFSGGSRFLAVVHGTYHSGTLCLPGLVLQKQAQSCREQGETEQAAIYQDRAEMEMNSKYSFLHLAELCKRYGVPLYVAPSTLGKDQYETMNVVAEQTDAMLLNATIEAVYAKLVLALTLGMNGEQLATYMRRNINNELL